MLVLIGITLLFAGATAALGMESAVQRAQACRWNGVSRGVLLVQSLIMVWFTAAGLWALLANGVCHL